MPWNEGDTCYMFIVPFLQPLNLLRDGASGKTGQEKEQLDGVAPPISRLK